MSSHVDLSKFQVRATAEQKCRKLGVALQKFEKLETLAVWTTCIRNKFVRDKTL